MVKAKTKAPKIKSLPMVRVDEATHATLKGISMREGLKIGFMVRQAVEEWVARHNA